MDSRQARARPVRGNLASGDPGFLPAAANARSGTRGSIGGGSVGKEILTYDDLLQIVELIKSAEAFSEFHLKIGDIELDLRKSGPATSNPSGVAVTAPSPAPREPVTVEDAVPAPHLLKP